MKKKLIVVFALVTAVLLVLSGCADFAFNPVGRWEASEERLYADGAVQASAGIDEGQFGVRPALVFKKNGKGYIDSGTKNKIEFTYEYSDDSITIERPKTESTEASAVKYAVTDNGTAIAVTIDEYDGEESGKTVHYRREILFKR